MNLYIIYTIGLSIIEDLAIVDMFSRMNLCNLLQENGNDWIDWRGLQAVSFKDYEDVLKSLITLLSNVDSVDGVYEFGKYNTPGISDLDILVIAADEACKKVMDLIWRWRNSTDKNKYLMVHLPVVLPRSHAHLYPIVAPLDKFTKKAGDVPEFDKFGSAGRTKLQPNIANYLHINMNVWVALARVLKRSTSLRFYLLLLKNVEHSVRMAGSMTDKIDISRICTLNKKAREMALQRSDLAVEFLQENSADIWEILLETDLKLLGPYAAQMSPAYDNQLINLDRGKLLCAFDLPCKQDSDLLYEFHPWPGEAFDVRILKIHPLYLVMCQAYSCMEGPLSDAYRRVFPCSFSIISDYDFKNKCTELVNAANQITEICVKLGINAPVRRVVSLVPPQKPRKVQRLSAWLARNEYIRRTQK